MDMDTFGACFLAVAVALLVLNLINYFAHSLLVSSLILVLVAAVVYVVLSGGVGNLNRAGRRRR